MDVCIMLSDGEPEAQLVFGTRKEIRKFSLDTKDNSLIISVPHDIWDFAIGPPPEENVYWTDVKNHAVYSIPLSAVDVTFDPMSIIIDYGLILPVGITVDWIASNLYIADSGRKELIACSLMGKTCTIVQKNVGKPRSLAIDPDTRELYWTDWDSPAKIEKSWLDGTNRKVFLSRSMAQPYGIVVDRTIERLFWVDQRYNKIESVKLDGTDRKKIFHGGIYQLFGVAVFEDRIFWSDASKKNVMTAHKFIGNYVSVLIKAAPKPRVLKIAHPYLYRAEAFLPTDNACERVTCDGLCLQSNNEEGYSCSCSPDDTQSLTHCHTNLLMSQLYFSAKDMIYHFPLNKIGLRSLLIKNITTAAIGNVGSLDIDTVTRKIIYVDTKNKCIAAVELDSGVVTEKILYRGIGRVNGLAVDWVVQNVYWTDATNDTIQVARLDGTARMTFLAFTMYPMAIALDMSSGYVYFSESMHHNSAASGFIMKCESDGSSSVVVHDAGFANDITIDQISRRLFWTDSYNVGIFSVSLINPLDETTHWSGSDGFPFLLALTEDLLYWSDKEDNVIRSVKKDDKNTVQELLKHDDLTGLAIWNADKLKRVHHQCIKKNGGCSHLCLRMGEKQLCRCPDGMKLGSDSVTCVVADLVDNNTNFAACPHGKRKTDNNTCVDVNECAVNYRLCSQECYNTDGSYQCRCGIGYVIDHTDETNCKADEGKYPLSYVIVADAGKLWKVVAETEKHDVTPDGSTGSIEIFDVDSYNHHIIFVGSPQQQYALLEYDPVNNVTRTIAEDFGPLQALALDWVGQNIYYTKSNEVGACQRNGIQTNCKVFFTNLSSVKGIALCPHKGLMFWSNIYKHSIESAWMDGTHRMAIVQYGLVSPYSISVDLPANRLYWVDQHESLIESTKLDGSQRFSIRVELYNPVLTSVDVFENLLYFTAVDKSIGVAVKLDGQQKVLDEVKFSRPGAIKIVHQLKQMKMKNCDDVGCSQMCLVRPEAAAMCACGDNFMPADDAKYCIGSETRTTDNMFLSECLKNCTDGGTCVLEKSGYICICPANSTATNCWFHVPVNASAHTLANRVKGRSLAWIAGPVSAVILLVAGIVAVRLYCRSSRIPAHRSLRQMIRYHANIVLRKPTEADTEELVSEVSMDNPSYQEYEDLNYPKDKMNWCMSTTSIDSAFASKRGGNGNSSHSSESTHSSSGSEN